MDETKNNFYLQVARSLESCQLVEQELKLYLTTALLLAKKCCEGRMPFKLSGDDYSNKALGRLIEAFDKLGDNPALVRDLKEFKKHRDFLSHAAIANCIYPDGEFSSTDASDLQDRLKNIRTEGDRLAEALHGEVNKIRVHLDFEVIKD